MKEVKKIQSLSLAKVVALFYGLVSFIVALGVAISAMANIVIQEDFNGSAVLVALFNLGAGLILGLAVAAVAAFFGWIFGLIAAVLYNLFAARFGGLKIELNEEGDRRETEDVKKDLDSLA